jgi:hypothetical protein
MSQDEDQALDAAWRRASAADAGRPSAGTRAAILAEAAAVARRRQPAANESRYWLSAVAGVAVIGVGVLVWRQVDVRMPGEPPQVTVELAVEKDAEFAQPAESAQATDSAAAEEDAESPAPSQETAGSREQAPARRPAPASAAAPPAQTQQLERAADAPAARGNVANAESLRDSASGAGAAEGAVTQSAPPAPAPPSAVPEARSPAAADEREELNEVQITGTRILRSDPRSVGPRPGVVAPVRPPPPPSEAMQLLRSQFPALLDSDRAHRPWLVLDATGNVLRSGELTTNESLEDVAERLEREMGSRPGRWRVERVTNTRGQVIEVGISRVP